MQNIRKTLYMTSLLFGVAMLFCFIGWHLGYEGFIIVGDIEVPYWVHFSICLLLLLTSNSLQGGFVLKEYSFNILKYSIPITLTEGIRCLYFPEIFAQLTLGFLPMFVFSIIGIYRKEKMFYIDNKYRIPIFRGVIPRVIIMNLIVLLHQFILSRITFTPLTHEISLYMLIRFNFDILPMYLLFYSIGGVDNARWEQLVFPGRPRSNKSWNESYPNNSGDMSVNEFEKWVMRSVIGVVQVLQWSFILWICSLDNLFLDGLVMTTSFICHGMIISKRKHLRPIILCTLAATAMFYFAAKFTISFQYSQFFPIVIGLIMVYTLYRVSYQFELTAKEKTKDDLKRIEKLEKDISEAWVRLDELSSF